MASETKRLRKSGLLTDFVRQQQGAWDHQDWLTVLGRVRAAGYTALPDHEVGQILGEEKARFWAARSAAATRARTKPLTSAPNQRRG